MLSKHIIAVLTLTTAINFSATDCLQAQTLYGSVGKRKCSQRGLGLQLSKYTQPRR